MSVTIAARRTAAWTVTHGVTRVVFRQQARRGNPIARISRDPQVHDDPTALWAAVRAQGPLVRGDYAWVTTSHPVMSAVMRSDDFGVQFLGEETWTARLLDATRDPWAAGPIDPPSLLTLDPPDHTRLRRLVARAFTARRVAGMTARIEETTAQILDRLAGRRRFDLVEEFASLLPVAVIADLLGVPERDRGPLLEWGNAAAWLLDAGLTYRRHREADLAVRAMHRWMDGHLRRLSADPGEDLLSQVLLHAAELPEPPTDLELRQLGLLVLGAGFETTVSLLGNAAVLLSAHPNQRDLLVADPTGWPNAVEEVLRCDSPVQLNARVARREVDLRALPGLRDLSGLPASPLRRGSVVIAMIGAAHRDPSVFADPDVFDVRRPDADQHLAFSAGAHFCLGAVLARSEATIGLRMLYDRFPHLAVDGPLVRRGTRVLRGFERIPVRV